MARMGHGQFDIDEVLKVQHAMPIPNIGDGYYLATDEVLTEHDRITNYINMVNEEEGIENRVRRLIPDEFYAMREELINARQVPERETDAQKEKIAALENQYPDPKYSKTCVLNLKSLPEKERLRVAQNMIAELDQRFDLPAMLVDIKDSKHHEATDTLLACVQGTYHQTEDGKWVEQKADKAVSKFLALAVVKGLVTEEALEEKGMMPGVRKYETQALIKQLRTKQIKPIMDAPIFGMVSPSLPPL